MNKPLFYAPNIVAGSTFQLEESESKHAIRVLRLTVGSELAVVNGKGSIFHCTVVDAHPKRCLLQIEQEAIVAEPLPKLSMAVAPTKNTDRYSWFLEKATEIGIHSCVPLTCEHSERKQLKVEKLQKTVVAALKQSQRAHLPEVTDPQSFSNFVTCPFEGQKFIAHCAEGDKTPLKLALREGEAALILIGPEGDFSSLEIEAAISAGFVPISLGNSRLRTETAAIVACHTFNLINA